MRIKCWTSHRRAALSPDSLAALLGRGGGGALLNSDINQLFSVWGLLIAGEGEGAENTGLEKAQVFPECFRCSGRFREARKVVPVRRLPKD